MTTTVGDAPQAVLNDVQTTPARANSGVVSWATLAWVFVAMVLSLSLFTSSAYLGSSDLHSAMEVIGGPIGLVAGLTFIHRYLALGDRAHLFFGLAFFVNASADIVHGALPFLISRGVLDLPVSALDRFLPLSFLAGRTTAALVLIAAPTLIRRLSNRERLPAQGLSIGVVVIGAIMSSILYLVPLPAAVYPEQLIGRPADMLTAFLFVPATLITYRWHRRTGDPMAWWVSLFAMAGAVGQFWMGFSTHLYDIHFDGAHAFKVVSYLLPLVGLSLYQVRLIAQRDEYAGRLEERADVLAEANEQLARANAIKTEFVSVVSHELRTPLTAILGFASTMAEFWEDTPDDEKREHLAIIERQGIRLSRLINDLLAMSQLESGTLETFLEDLDVSELCTRIVRDLGVRAEMVEVELADGLYAKADPDHVEQILVNFLTNATRYGEPPIRLVGGRQPDGRIEVIVEDRGTGVPEAFRPHLFEKFAQADTGPTRRSQGTGLGLAIVRGLAHAQGGEAWYEPNEPRGSRFGIRLPPASEETHR